MFAMFAPFYEYFGNRLLPPLCPINLSFTFKESEQRKSEKYETNSQCFEVIDGL